jgi:hypothetical protein
MGQISDNEWKQAPNGTLAAPAIAFASDPDTGIYRSNSNVISIVQGGSVAFEAGSSNTSSGHQSLYSNTTGVRNAAYGLSSLYSNTTGFNNAAFGFQSLYWNAEGFNNAAFGLSSLFNNTTGARNAAYGFHSLSSNTTGFLNVAFGTETMRLNTTGAHNVAIGAQALLNSTAANFNTALGYQSLRFTVAGGALSGVHNVTGVGADTRVSGSNQVQLGDSNTTVYAYGAVQNRSDQRDKTDISVCPLGMNFVMSLSPKAFVWDYRDDYFDVQNYTDEDGNPQTRLVAVTKDGSRKRTRKHMGLLAQDVKTALDAAGVDCGLYQDHSVAGGEDVLSLGYEELIPILIKAIQELNSRVTTLEGA